MSAYFIHLMILVGIYGILALSLQFVMGFGGLLNLGHIAFFAIGAYASALLNMAGYPYLLCLLVAILLPTVLAFIISKATDKLKGDYLALATLGFSFVVFSLANNWTSLTRGPLGIPGIPKPMIFSYHIDTNTKYLIMVVIFVIVAYVVIKIISLSPFGKTLEAIRDNETEAKTLGKNTAAIKDIAIIISAMFAGLAGSLYAHYITYIDPASFSFSDLMPILVIVILGGLASLEGTLFATLIIVLMPEVVRFVGLPSSMLGPARLAIYSLLLLFILLFLPKGFDGKIEFE